MHVKSYILVGEHAYISKQVQIGNIFTRKSEVDDGPFAAPEEDLQTRQTNFETDVNFSQNISKDWSLEFRAKVLSFLGMDGGTQSAKTSTVLFTARGIETRGINTELVDLDHYASGRLLSLKKDLNLQRRLGLDGMSDCKLYMITGVKIATGLKKYTSQQTMRSIAAGAGVPADLHGAVVVGGGGSGKKGKTWSLESTSEGPLVIAYQLSKLVWKDDSSPDGHNIRVKKNVIGGALGTEGSICFESEDEEQWEEIITLDSWSSRVLGSTI